MLSRVFYIEFNFNSIINFNLSLKIFIKKNSIIYKNNKKLFNKNCLYYMN